MHLTAVASHRGVVQPLQQMARLCQELGLPLVVDAAQALGQLDCSVGVDAVYASSRKWLAGPRGVGVLAVASDPDAAAAATTTAAGVGGVAVGAERLEFGEANIAARVGFSVAIGEHVAAGPGCGAQPGWRRWAGAAGPPSPTCPDGGWSRRSTSRARITTLAPLDGADPQKIRAWLIAERRIVTTSVGIERAPLELTAPVLRISPHVDATDDDLATFAAALTEATAAGW